jgi:hypothetical protein
MQLANMWLRALLLSFICWLDAGIMQGACLSSKLATSKQQQEQQQNNNRCTILN